MKKVFVMENLDCANCAAKMEDAVRKIPGVSYVSISFMAQRMTLEADDAAFDEIAKKAAKACARLCRLFGDLIERGIVCLQRHPLCHKADADIAHAGDLPDGVLHFGGAVGAIQIFHNKHFFHDGFPFAL